jgi:hypothetical protein
MTCTADSAFLAAEAFNPQNAVQAGHVMLLCQIQYLALLPCPSVHAHARNEIPVPRTTLSDLYLAPVPLRCGT